MNAGYFGTYSVDTATQVVSYHVQATVRSAESGTVDRTYKFKGGNLYLTAKAIRDKLPVIYILVWKRATIGEP